MWIFFDEKHYNEWKKALKNCDNKAKVSLDLGLSYQTIDCDLLKKLVEKGKKAKLDKETIYFLDEKFRLKKPVGFEDGIAYSLKMYKNVPVLIIAGKRMHPVTPFKNPLELAKNIVKALKIRKGTKVLECCTGLGYIAKECLKAGAKVLSIEKSRIVVELAKLNPFSKEIYENKNFKQIIGDAKEVVKNLKGKYDWIILDPPDFTQDQSLYIVEFYKNLKKLGKRMYHYVGPFSNPKVRKTVKERLSNAGWKIIKILKKERAFICNAI